MRMPGFSPASRCRKAPSRTASHGGTCNGPEEIDADIWFTNWERGGVLLEDARHLAQWDQTVALIWFEDEEVPAPPRIDGNARKKNLVLPNLMAFCRGPGPNVESDLMDVIARVEREGRPVLAVRRPLMKNHALDKIVKVDEFAIALALVHDLFETRAARVSRQRLSRRWRVVEEIVDRGSPGRRRCSSPRHFQVGSVCFNLIPDKDDAIATASR